MITQKFPFLLPLRVMQRKIFFYAKMKFDGCVYSKTIQVEAFPNRLFSADNGLYNRNTGFDMIYQENKVFNLKLAAKTLNGLLIKPNETFSLCQAMRYADKHIPFKEGLTVLNGELTTTYGGGLCQMSNLLFWVFLHSPLTIVERHTHKAKEFPTMRDTEPEGVDATINEGWFDLKVKNETSVTFQIGISFDDEMIRGSLYTSEAMAAVYEIEGRNLTYFREKGTVYQKTAICRKEIDIKTKKVLSDRLLYENLCVIGYPLPDDVEILEKG